MSTTATITVACPRCTGPAIVTVTTSGPDTDDHIVEFACSQGHAISGAEARGLWDAAHQPRAPRQAEARPERTS